MTKSVQQALVDLGELYAKRNAIYKNSYIGFGNILVAMFPDGITLTTAEEFNRFTLFLHLMNKTTRYARNIHDGGHPDSLDDLSVYAQMLQEFDGLQREKVKNEHTATV